VDNYYKPSGFGGFSFFPPVIKNLLIINAVVFFLTIIAEQLKFSGVPGWYIIYRWFALNPISGVDPAGQPFNFQVWQLITYQFLHANFSHILFNMIGLWMFGMEIENLWGSRKFLYFYLLCGVAAGLFHLFLSPLLGEVAFTLGASGAIFGVLVAFGLFFPNRYIFLYFFIPVKAKYLIGFFVILEFLMVNNGGGNVAHLAHLGGALAGFIFILLDRNSHIELKSIFKRTGFQQKTPLNPFGGMNNPFKKKPDIEEGKFYEHEDGQRDISQAEIDEILDKISKSGYQNLTSQEKKVLFEASKKMK
jgi:membrane associated rhomboid family serine protease